MPPPAVVILGYSEAAMFLRRTPPPYVSAILSIHGKLEFGVDCALRHRLDLSFDDVEVVDANDPDSLLRTHARRRWAEQNGLSEVPPTLGDAASIIRFAESLRDADGTLLIHCAGGMSRAPAAALICLAAWRDPGDEAACVEEVLRVRRGAVPHVGLVRFADELLGRNGKITEALRQPDG